MEDLSFSLISNAQRRAMLPESWLGTYLEATGHTDILVLPLPIDAHHYLCRHVTVTFVTLLWETNFFNGNLSLRYLTKEGIGYGY